MSQYYPPTSQRSRSTRTASGIFYFHPTNTSVSWDDRYAVNGNPMPYPERWGPFLFPRTYRIINSYRMWSDRIYKAWGCLRGTIEAPW